MSRIITASSGGLTSLLARFAPPEDQNATKALDTQWTAEDLGIATQSNLESSLIQNLRYFVLSGDIGL